jgi:predicted permease
LGLTPAERSVVVVESAMPVAIFNFLFARVYGNRPDEVAGMVLISTLLSYGSLPLTIALVQ